MAFFVSFMEVKEIRKQELDGKENLYFVRYSDDSVCVFQKVRRNRITENNGKRYCLWSADLDKFPDQEFSETVKSTPKDFSSDEVHVKQNATDEHLKALVR